MARDTQYVQPPVAQLAPQKRRNTAEEPRRQGGVQALLRAESVSCPTAPAARLASASGPAPPTSPPC